MSYKEVLGVNISPSVVEFIDAEADVVHQMKISVQNFGKTSRHIRFLAPATNKFRLQCKELEKTIAPGLEFVALVEYFNRKDEDCEDCIVFMIDDKFVEVPIVSYAPKSTLVINGVVNFGTTVADGQVHTKETAILNHGTKNGKYRILAQSESRFRIMPLDNIVQAGYSQPIRIEFISKEIGTFEEKVSIEFEDQPISSLTVKAHVVPRALVLLSNDRSVEKVSFGLTYYGTDVVRTYWLYNSSPEPTRYVTILDDEGEGQEIGIDLSRSILDVCNKQTEPDDHVNELSSLISVQPHEGILKPYEKQKVHMKFSPRSEKPLKGWKSNAQLPPRRDFALFMKIQMVGNNDKESNMEIELALTGTALPVFLSVLPSLSVEFPDTVMGKKEDTTIKIRNDSPELPVTYTIDTPAHFHAKPACGFVNISSMVDVLLSFQPNQVGTFKKEMILNVIGQQCNIERSSPVFKKFIIETHVIQIIGTSPSVRGLKHPSSYIAKKSNGARKNKSQENIDVATSVSLEVFHSNQSPETMQTNKRDCEYSGEEKLPVKIAHANDRTSSIRPANRNENYRTRFTKQKRYSYIDQDYQYTVDESSKTVLHKAKYTSYIREEKKKRDYKKQAKEFKKLNNDIDLGIKSSQGLQPTKLTLDELHKTNEKYVNAQIQNAGKKDQLISAKTTRQEWNQTFCKKASEGLKAIPSTTAEKEHCNALLTPQELFQIQLEPRCIDFGDVCCKSLCSKNLLIANNIEKTIFFQVEINCRELRQTSPLSQVVPPGNVAKLEFIFESASYGKYECLEIAMEISVDKAKIVSFLRSVPYTINHRHKGHLIIHANVITTGLEISTDRILLEPTFGMPAQAGYRNCVTLINKRNLAAEFTWSPVVTREGTSFTIRPAKGVVEPFSTLVCEVTFYPAFSVSFTGEFMARILNGNELKLSCEAKTGLTSCSFIERRLMFGAIPLNIPTIRYATLKNTSVNHAFFRVVDVSPIHGMIICPKEGVVPVGGTTRLVEKGTSQDVDVKYQVSYKPNIIHKFDTEVEIEVRDWKRIKIRMGGQVEIPSVDVDVNTFHCKYMWRSLGKRNVAKRYQENFQFGGVFGGATSYIPFKIKNLGLADVQVVCNLSYYRDFKIKFDDAETEYTENEGVFCVSVPGQQFVSAQLQFTPTEVATYDFILPVSINHILAPSPPPSPYPMSVVPARSYGTISPTVKSEPSGQIYEIATPRRRVQSVGLRSPLQLSTKVLNFHLPSGYYDLNVADTSGRVQTILFVNNSNEKLAWSLDVESCGKYLLNAGVFKFLYKNGPICGSESNQQEVVEMNSGETFELRIAFNPVESGCYTLSVPVLLNSEKMQHYTTITLNGDFQAPKLKFQPSFIKMQAVPLATDVVENVKIIGTGFNRDSKIEVKLPEVEVDDGGSLSVFHVNLPDGDTIQRCPSSYSRKNLECCTLSCEVTFNSTKPVSYAGAIKFMVDGQIYTLPVCATADNCLLTTHEFLSNTQNDFHIVCERIKEKKSNSDASAATIFVPFVSPIRTPTCPSMMTNSTSFSFHTSSYEDSSLNSSSMTASSSNAHTNTLENPTADTHDHDLLPYQQEEGIFPQSSTLEGKYLYEISKTVQRWYSSLCWSLGFSTSNLPLTLRKALTSTNVVNSSNRSGSWNREERKDKRSIVDLVINLCGKPVPGIPLNLTLPNGKEEKLKTILWVYSTLLTFLRCQGAMVSCIKPEYLLDRKDYVYYMKKRMEDREEIEETRRDDEMFEILSRKTWIMLLLQILKVLYLARVTPQSLKKISWPRHYAPFPVFTSNPLSSNVYGLSERIILAWLNHHYEQQRTKCWKRMLGDNEPPSRWIVNFENDFVDGLVLASLIAAYTPYVVKTHLHSMYTRPNSAEQCLHNALKVIQVFRFIGLDLDVLATDITEPNAISMLLLSVHLYQRLPLYLPKSDIEFMGSLHSTVSKHVKLQNPSNKALLYHAVLCGDNGEDFSLPTGKLIQVPPKGEIHLPLEYKSRFLSKCEGTLILVGRRAGTAAGLTLVFNLRCAVDTIIPMEIIKCSSVCYELKKLSLSVQNPFDTSGTFKVVVVETTRSECSKSILACRRKLKKDVPSKTNHGRKKVLSPPKPLNGKLPDNTANESPYALSSFWTPLNEITLEADTPSTLEIHFLPFDVGERQCSILFMNKDIGEFLYSIEAEATLPLPSAVPFQRESSQHRISSGRASHNSHGTIRVNDATVYLHCEAEKHCVEELQIPVINTAKEKAMVLAAQQQMSEKELRRREMSGVLSSESIVNAVQSLRLNDNYTPKLPPSEVLGETGPLKNFTVEVSSPFFQAPPTICIPIPGTCSGAKETVRIPLKIPPCKPGQYPCQIVLKSLHDIRVFHVECTVKHAGTHVQLEFETPTHEFVVQKVPVVNHSDLRWEFDVVISGKGFSGPSTFVADAVNTSYYPLKFSPVYEGLVEGQLILKNRMNGGESIFMLSAMGTKPLAVETVDIDCFVNESTMKVLEVTNILKHRMIFQTFSDLDVISGPSIVTVLPRQTVQIPIDILTKKRGVFEGTLMFIYDKEFVDRTGLGRPLEIDSDSDDDTNHLLPRPNRNSFLSVTNSTRFADLSETRLIQKPYRIWYNLRINSIPTKAEKQLEITAPIHLSASMELLLNNPLKTELLLDVTIDGIELYGAPSVTILANSSMVYQVEYKPTVVGKSNAKIIFHGESFTEFWYDLLLIGEHAQPKVLPDMQCVIGKSCKQGINLQNPSVDTIIYSITCSNVNNFCVECDNSDNMVSVPALSEVEIPLVFTPTAIGKGDHKAEITFTSKQTGPQSFHVSGIGDPPLVSTDHVIHADLGGSSSTIINYKNPFDYDVIVDVFLQHSPVFGQDPTPVDDKDVFSLLLKRATNLIMPSKALVEIPISFAPDNMQKVEIECCVATRRFYGEDESNLQNSDVDNKSDVTWRYVVQGIPVSSPLPDGRAPVIKCRARERFEEKVEITFTGLDINVSKTTHTDLMRALSPMHLLGQYVPQTSDETYEELLEDFLYDFQYSDIDAQSDIARSVAVKLKRKLRNKITGMFSLLFEVILSPSKSFNHLVHLTITSSDGGLWKYPIRFASTEPIADDVIIIESTGLNKETSVSFRLHSQSSIACPYEAYFATGSDDMFKVSPQSGILSPVEDEGTLFTISYKPTYYGKVHYAKLLIQTRDLQWVYDIKGTTPTYQPPQVTKAIDSRLTLTKNRKKNFVRQNLNVIHTGVSSPLKGAPLVTKTTIQ